MEFSLVIAIIVFGIIAQSVEGEECKKKCFAQICSSNPSNMIRVWDRFGSGAYGASRCTHHFPPKVFHSHRPYLKSKRPHNVGIHLLGTGAWKGYGVKLFYVKKGVYNGRYVSAGTFIGYMTNMAPEYGFGITNNVHVQVDKKGVIVNPAKFFC